MAGDNWELTELGQMGGDTFDVRYDPATHTVRLSSGGTETERFEVDPADWQAQAARELAARGYGPRWNQWDTAESGGSVMSAARTRYPDADPGRPAGDDWESGAASYSAAAADAPDEPPAAPLPPAEYGRVRVYPQYTFPVYQTGEGGFGTDEIVVTDWDKQGRAWAETEAKRQITEAVGEPSDDATGGPWWMGKATKGEQRWKPFKGTPRSAKPTDGLPPPPPWKPWLQRETETAPVPPAETDGREMRFGANGEEISPAEYDRRVNAAAAAGTPFVLRPQDVETGDRVRDPSSGELGTVREVTGTGGVVVDLDQGAGRHVLASALEGGALQKVPRDATPASLEERFSPAEQAERYADRRAHHETERGTGTRARNGYRKHKAGCSTCQDLDRGGDGVGRQLRVEPAPVAEPAPTGDPAVDYPVKFTFTGGLAEDGEIRHYRWEAALEALTDQVAAWRIPPDGTGVLDTDAFIASIGGYVGGLGAILGQLAERLGGGQTPIAAVVGEVWADFASALEAMSAEAAVVYQQWTDNDDNAHDLRRARGEIPGAELFNVGA